MPQSRNELIKEIKEARVNAKSNLLYVKGLTKLKKKELIEIAKSLQNNTSEELESNKKQIEDELDELEEETEQRQEQLEELEGLEPEPEPEQPEPEPEPEPKDELVDAEQYLKSLVEDVEKIHKKKTEKKQHVRMSKTSVETQIKKLMCEFSEKLSIILKPYQRKFRNNTLNIHDIDDIVDSYDNYREDTKDKIDLIIDELSEDDELSERFFKYINDYFDRQNVRVNRLLE
jgi:gas vesicle protein